MVTAPGRRHPQLGSSTPHAGPPPPLSLPENTSHGLAGNSAEKLYFSIYLYLHRQPPPHHPRSIQSANPSTLPSWGSTSVSNRLMVLMLAAGLSEPPRRPTMIRIVGSLGQPFGIVSILVARQTTVHRLPEKAHQSVLHVTAAPTLLQTPHMALNEKIAKLNRWHNESVDHNDDGGRHPPRGGRRRCNPSSGEEHKITKPPTLLSRMPARSYHACAGSSHKGTMDGHHPQCDNGSMSKRGRAPRKLSQAPSRPPQGRNLPPRAAGQDSIPPPKSHWALNAFADSHTLGLTIECVGDIAAAVARTHEWVGRCQLTPMRFQRECRNISTQVRKLILPNSEELLGRCFTPMMHPLKPPEGQGSTETLTQWIGNSAIEYFQGEETNNKRVSFPSEHEHETVNRIAVRTQFRRRPLLPS